MREGWEIKKFNEVFDLQMGKTPDRKTPQYFEGDNVWVSIRDMGTKEISDSNEHISDEAISASNIRKVKKGTVIMSFKLTVGKCAIAAKDLYTNEAIMAFNLKEGYNVKPDFLYYYLRAYKWTGANKAVMGMTLNKATISQHRLGIPPLSEQQRVVEELDLLSSIIEKKKEQLKELDNLSQSIFYDMFGDPETNEKGWEVKKLGEVIKVIGGYAFKSSIFSNNGVKLVQIANVWKDSLLWNEQTFIPVKEAEIKSIYLLHPGDIVMALTRPIIKSLDTVKIAIVREHDVPCVLNQRVCKFEFDTRVVHPIWFYNFTKSAYFKAKINYFGSKGMQPNVSTREIESVLLFTPPLPLQLQFALKVEAIEKQKELIKRSIAEVETMFNSRMDYYFN